MPVDFPNMDSLKKRAKMWGFREPNVDESEPDYRIELSGYVRPSDRIESLEILFGAGWDKWTDAQKALALCI
jgi:hypothetical protein